MDKSEKAIVGFHYRPALMRATAYYRVEPHTLTRLDAQGRRLWTQPWTDIAALRYAHTNALGYRMQRLDIELHSGPRRRLPLTTTIAQGPDDPDRIAFHALVSNIAHSLANKAPEIPVNLGEPPSARLWLFGIGMLGLIFSFSIILIALADGISTERAGAAAIPLIALIMLCGGLAVVFHPWRTRMQVPIGQFADQADQFIEL